MSGTAGPPRDATGGSLGCAAATITWFLVVAVGQITLLLPGLLASLFLERDASNLPLVWLLLLPAGPALAAGLASLRARERDDDRGPVRAFLHGLRQNWWDAVRVWALGTGLVALLAFNTLLGGTIGLPPAYGAFVVVVGVLLLTWTLVCLVVATAASFRFRDVLRLGGYYTFSRPLVSLGVIGIVLMAAVALATTFDAVLVLFAWLPTLALSAVSRPVVTHLLATFVREDEAA